MLAILAFIFLTAFVAAIANNRRLFEDVIGLAFLWRILKSFRNPVHFTRKKFPKNIPSEIILGANENLIWAQKAKAQVFKVEKKDEYSQLFKGNLFLTDYRLVFVHGEGCITILRKKIVSIVQLRNGVKIFVEGKNPIFFMGKNLDMEANYQPAFDTFSVEDFMSHH